jgi:hypothetical protein
LQTHEHRGLVAGVKPYRIPDGAREEGDGVLSDKKPLIFQPMLKTMLSPYAWVHLSIGTPGGRPPTKKEIERLKRHIDSWLKDWD